MKQAMKDQDTDLFAERPFKSPRVATRDDRRNRNVPQIRGRRSRRNRGSGGVVRAERENIATPARASAPLPPFHLLHRKRQHVGRSNLASISPIPPRDLRIRDQANGDRIGRKAKCATRAREEFSQFSHGNADIALAVQNHVSYGAKTPPRGRSARAQVARFTGSSPAARLLRRAGLRL